MLEKRHSYPMYCTSSKEPESETEAAPAEPPRAGAAPWAGKYLAKVTPSDLTAWVGSELSAHKRPREVRFVSSLPRNEMGKVQKTRLVPR